MALTPPVVGDFNADRSVDGTDLSVWRGNFGASGSTPVAGDGDADEDVDGADFLAWQRNVGRSNAPQTNGSPPAIVPVVTVDDGDWGYRERGLWQNGPSNAGWQGDHRTIASGSTSGSATWVTQLTAGRYEVFATWEPGADHSGAAEYTLLDGTATVGVVVRNQKLAPDDAEHAGRNWQSLGTYQFATGIPTIRLDQNAAGMVVADGIAFVDRNDVTPPAINLQLGAVSDTGTVGDGVTETELVSLEGTTEPGLRVALSLPGFSAVSDSAGRFAFHGVPLELGNSLFTAEASDAGGNVGTGSLMVTRTAVSGAIVLSESGVFVAESSVTIDLGQTAGSRTLSFRLDSRFDKTDASTASEDRFLVYLVDPANPSQTLLDHGAQGTPLFALAGDKAEYVPGLVRYDGSLVTVDLTSLGSRSQGKLTFQLLNGDGDDGSQVAVSQLINVVDIVGAASPVLASQSSLAPPGGSLDVTAMTLSSQLELIVENVRFNSESGRYVAELKVRNAGSPIGRQVALVLAGLPLAVTVSNRSGTTPGGSPYLNLTSAIPSGGLGTGETSGAVRVEIDDPSLARFELTPAFYIGGPNRSPQFQAIPALLTTPGAVLTVPLIAPDQDGDRVTFSFKNPSQLPSIRLTAAGELVVSPDPGDIGSYTFTLVASDGAVDVEREVTLDVVADPNTVTRISGVVLNTNGQPLDNVPVEIAGFSARTAADGSFTISLPTKKTPTESFNISIPTGDVFLDPFNTGTQQIPFRRARFDVTSGDSALNPRQHPNLVSSFIDASTVYGSDSERAAALRTFSDGKLKTSAGNLLPLNDAATFPGGPLENDNEGRLDAATLFASGDVRTNENVALIAIHTVFVREHNRLADEIKAADPLLSDETIYQQARRILGAIIQQITYSEYLPLLLGPTAIAPYAGYDPTVDPRESELFATAAFRLGHTQLAPEFQRLDSSQQTLPGGSIALRNAFFTAEPIKTDGIEPFLRGLAATPMQEMDTKLIDDVRNFLFGPPGSGGMDLASINIQRGRDVGLPSYAQARLDFGLSAVTSFAQITSNVETQAALQGVYGSVDKIDVWVGALAEDRAAGALVGPLLQAILKDQFERTRDGDRFWFENSQFTAADLSTIRGTTLEQLIERNAPGVDLAAHSFTTGIQPSGPAPAGSVAPAPPTEVRSIDGSKNNLADPLLGATGGNVLRNFTNGYGDGISTPGGADRPGAREISNAVNAQTGSIPNADGVTSLLIFWGQILDHDLGLTPGGVGDTLKIQGNLRPVNGDGAAYPFVAEKMELMLNHAVYPGVDNVIARPIYLPAIDVANEVPINPTVDTLVTTTAIPGASVMVGANTLEDRQGQMFTGELSITEVPRDFTPAVLPSGLMPDVVVTIQPADMVFTTPVPLSLPNRSGFPPGLKMDLWSINPITGFFDNVGVGEVSADGSVVNTISGGIRNSSWHFFGPRPVNPTDETQDPACGGGEEIYLAGFSDVNLQSGAHIVSYDVATYQSQGQTRGVTLRYDSQRAFPVSTVQFSYDVIQTSSPTLATTANSLLAASVTVGHGGTAVQVPAAANSAAGMHLWSIEGVTVGQKIGAGVPVDLSRVPSGIYDYSLSSGFGLATDNGFSGSLAELQGGLISVNSVDSAIGSGWGIAGVQEVVENATSLVTSWAGSVILIDGAGDELLFLNPQVPGQRTYYSPMGDFSTFEKLESGLYRRTTTDGTVYDFGANLKLSTVTGRNGNITRYEYDGERNVTQITDSAGLPTTFEYMDGKLSAIVNPDGRETLVTMDTAGNLVAIEAPDGAEQRYGYDANHLLTAEVTPRGDTAVIEYNSAGQFTSGTHPDGTQISFTAASGRGLAALDSAVDAESGLPLADTNFAKSATLVRESANVEVYELDMAGHLVSASDSRGVVERLQRDMNGLVTQSTDGRGNVSSFQYDARGNVLSTSDTLDSFNSPGGNEEVFSLFPGEQFAVGINPNSISLADVNGDGRLDMVTANNSSANVSVLLGDGSGGFAAARNFAVGDSPGSIKLGDIDGDGRLDVVTANALSNNVSVLLGDGSGGFAAARNFAVGSQLGSVTLGDVNLDGRLDLVTTLVFSKSISVLLGDGSGGFAAARNFEVGRDPRSVTLGDVNGDGQVDVVTSNVNTSDVSVLLGDGSGGFAAARNFEVGRDPRSVTLGDVNEDGQLDLVTANNRDFDVSVLLGDGSGDFAAARNFVVGSEPASVTLGDVNADGRLDLVTANALSNNVSLLLGDGSGGFADSRNFEVGRDPRSVTLGDVNGDDQLDIVTANFLSNNVNVLLGDGNGSFVTVQEFAVGSGPNAAALGDVNGDGRLDVVTANSNFPLGISVLLGDGNGSLGVAQNIPVSGSPVSVALGDLNGDGRLDVVTASYADRNVSVLLGDGSGGFGAARSYVVSGRPTSVALGDLNGDGRLEIVTVTADVLFFIGVSVLQGDDNGNFGVTQSIPVSGSPFSIVIGDVNADGRLDAVTAEVDRERGPGGPNPGLNGVSVLLGDGDGRFGVPQKIAVGSLPNDVALGDINGDGRLDVVTANSSSSSMRVLLGNGNGGFGVAQNFALSDLPNSVMLGDVNGDGRLDVVTTAFSSNSVSVLLGDGGGGFAADRTFAVGSGPLSGALGDLNGDGRLDVITTNFNSDNVSVLLNTDGAAAETATSAFTYDPRFSQATSRTDERGNVTNHDIDPANGNIRGVTRPEGQDVVFSYLADGQVDRMTDALGRITDYDYDALGRMTSVTYAQGTVDAGTMRYEYDDAGNRTAMVDENSQRTEYEYDPRNRLTLVRDALGNETTYDYDPSGNVTEIRDSRGNLTLNEYDNRDRLIRTEDAQGNITRFTYDGAGSLLAVVDPLGHITRHRYDVRNQRIETVDPDDGDTQFRYDADDNLISLTDPVGNRTQFFYDARNRLLKERDPLGKEIKYSYDGTDNLVRKTDRNGRVTEYEYDGLNRLTTETWVDGGNVVEYAYDATNNILSVTDAFSALEYEYDARNRVTSVDNHGSQVDGTPRAPRVVVDYAYDPAGNVLSVIDTINGAAGANTGYLYDALDRLAQLTQVGPGLSDKLVDFAYNELGQYESINRYRDLAGTQLVIGTSYDYDSLNRLTSLRHENATGTAVAFYDYLYDSASRITQIADVDGVTSYAYDDRDQLTGADHSDASQPDESYEYDANGNRIESHLHGTGYQSGPGNRLLSDGTYNYLYDDEGNTIKRTEIATGNYREFTWDHRNRLTVVTDKLVAGTPTQIVRFTYDALDRRISKSVDATPLDAIDAAFMSFAYDREDVMLDFLDADGSGAAPTTVAQRYLHGPAIDQVLGQDDARTTHWMLTDHLGSVRDLASHVGTIEEHQNYDSFGNAARESLSRYLFTGREWDDELDLGFYRSRYLDTGTGSFLAQDSLRFDAGDSNLARYVGNSPVLNTDPFGYDALPAPLPQPAPTPTAPYPRDLSFFNTPPTYDRAEYTTGLLNPSQLVSEAHWVNGFDDFVNRLMTLPDGSINSLDYYGHGFSEGSDFLGAKFGDQVLTLDGLRNPWVRNRLRELAPKFAPTGQMNMMVCNSGRGASGLEFLNELSKLLGVPVSGPQYYTVGLFPFFTAPVTTVVPPGR